MSYTFYYTKDALNKLRSSGNPRICSLSDGTKYLVGILNDETITSSIHNSFENSEDVGSLSKPLKELYDKARAFGVSGTTFTTGLSSAVESLGLPLGDTITSGLDAINDFIDMANKDWLSKHMEVADDYLFMYKGSTVSVPLNFTARLLTTNSNNPSILEECKYWIEKFIGPFETLDTSGLVGLQAPPNGYSIQADNLKKVFAGEATGEGNSWTNPKIDGTFTFMIGNKEIPSVVVEDCQLVESTTKCKVGGSTVPLYIDMNITLKCVCKLAQKFLLNFISK
jgi:hypothetical protein